MLLLVLLLLVELLLVVELLLLLVELGDVGLSHQAGRLGSGGGERRSKVVFGVGVDGIMEERVPVLRARHLLPPKERGGFVVLGR